MNFPTSRSLSAAVPSCTKSVTLRVDDDVIQLKQDRVVAVNGGDVTELPVWIDGVYIRHVSSVFLAGTYYSTLLY